MTRATRVLLRMYPRTFRERFQLELEQVLRTSARSHHGDLARGAVTEQWRETMATTAVRASDHPIALGFFVVGVAGTAVGVFLTIAWIGFAPIALLFGALAWTAGRRAGTLRPTDRWRSGSSRIMLTVIAVAFLLTLLMWGLRGVLVGA